MVSIHRVRGECLLRDGLEPGRWPLAPGPARGTGRYAASSDRTTLALATSPAVTWGRGVARLAAPLATRIADLAIRAACRFAARQIDLRVEGLEHMPATGPAIIAARHFHHFYDGCALVAVVPRPLKILVTLDWLENPLGLRLVRGACQMARWPIVVRSDSQVSRSYASLGRVAPAARQQLLAATRECVGLLREGELLLVFPE